MTPSPEVDTDYRIALFNIGLEGNVTLKPVQTIRFSELPSFSFPEYSFVFPKGIRGVHYFPQTSYKTYTTSGSENIWLVSHYSLVDRLCGCSQYHNGYGNHYLDAVCQRGEEAKANLFNLYGITFVPSTYERNGYLAMGEGDAYREFQTDDSDEENIEHLLNLNDGLAAFLALPLILQQTLLSGLEVGQSFIFGKEGQHVPPHKDVAIFELEDVDRTIKIGRIGAKSFLVATATSIDTEGNLPIHLFTEGEEPTFGAHLKAIALENKKHEV